MKTDSQIQRREKKMFTIENKGPEIVSTNYWLTEHAQRGYVFLSANAGAIRLLVPNKAARHLPDMLSAKEVIVSRGPLPEDGRHDALEILFEDYSEQPFMIHVGTERIDRMPADSDRNRSFVFAIWTPEGKMKEMPGRYRKVNRLPFGEPWRKSQ
jgi:hypothetical protein